MRCLGKTVVLVSSKGGSGKSTVAVGLATAFSREGKSVLLIDADEGARCLDFMLSVDKDTVFDLSDVLNGNAEIENAKLKVPFLDNVWVIPSPLSGEPIDLAALGELTQSLKEEYDYVIVDTKGQLPAERFQGFTKNAQFISVVTTDRIAVRNTGALNSRLVSYGFNPRLIINRFAIRNADGGYNNIDDIIDSASARLLGIIPEDRNIGTNKNGLLFGTASAAVFRIASRIEGRETPLPKIKDIL